MIRRALELELALLLLATAAGCQAPQAAARQEATRRWNVARARIKAQLAADRLNAGNVPEAAAELAEAQRLDPNDPERSPLQARLYLAQGKTRQALDTLEGVHFGGAAQAEVEYLKGVAWQQQQRWAEALAAFERACDLDDHEVAYIVAAAQTWLQLAQPQRALDLLTQRGASFDWTDTYQAALAECYEQLDDWPAAADAWQRVISSAGTPAPLRQRAAEALYRAARYQDAITVLRDLVEGDSAETSATLRLMLAECHWALGQSAPAREQAQSVLRRDPENAWALRVLARSLALEGELVAAQRVAQHALAVDGQDPRTLELLAGLAWRTGDRELAATAAARLAAIESGNPVAQYLLSQLR
jgi:tetratricopeptide (TPR) repeat protein